MANRLDPPPQENPDTNNWIWRNWFYRVWEHANQFCSPQLTVVDAGTDTLTHGLGRQPNIFSVLMENVVTESGWLPGEMIVIPDWDNMLILESTPTEIIVRYASPPSLTIIDKITRGFAAVGSFANWRVIIIAKV